MSREDILGEDMYAWRYARSRLWEYPCPHRTCDWVAIVESVMQGREELVEHLRADHPAAGVGR